MITLIFRLGWIGSSPGYRIQLVRESSSVVRRRRLVDFGTKNEKVAAGVVGAGAVWVKKLLKVLL